MNPEKCLIDTTIWVLYFKGEKELEDEIKSLILKERAATCEIVTLEVLRGAKSQKEYGQLHADFAALSTLRLTDIIWEKSYKIGFKLRRTGINVPLADILIATVASHYNCLLLHRDKHFPLIKGVLGLREREM
jgi:predicted nucleic acid-binding protein